MQNEEISNRCKKEPNSFKDIFKSEEKLQLQYLIVFMLNKIWIQQVYFLSPHSKEDVLFYFIPVCHHFSSAETGKHNMNSYNSLASLSPCKYDN